MKLEGVFLYFFVLKGSLCSGAFQTVTAFGFELNLNMAELVC